MALSVIANLCAVYIFYNDKGKDRDLNILLSFGILDFMEKIFMGSSHQKNS